MSTFSFKVLAFQLCMFKRINDFYPPETVISKIEIHKVIKVDLNNTLP